MRARAERLLGMMLRGRGGNVVEALLLQLGHRFPRRLPGRGIIARQLTRRHAGADLVARLCDGSHLSVPSSREAIAVYLHGRPYHEDERLTRLLLHELDEGSVFFDVGANVGFYTILAAGRCGRSGHVHAFEPQQALIRHLQKSIDLNAYAGRIRVTPAAVAARHGTTAEFFFTNDPQLYSVPSLLHHEWLEGESAVVPVIALDAYSLEHGIDRIDVIKIDIEGAEILALEGMQSLLQRRAPRIVVLELFPEILRFDSIGDGAGRRPAPSVTRVDHVLSLMSGYGYTAHVITARGRVGDRFEGSRVDRTTNLAFVRCGVAGEAHQPFHGPTHGSGTTRI